MASITLPCVLMRAGTSRGPFFLREWLPADERERDEALIGAIGASDLLQVDGVGGGSTLTSNPAVYAKVPFDTVRDFAPVTIIAEVPNVLIVLDNTANWNKMFNREMKALGDTLAEVHEFLSWTLVVVLVAHVAAALKHHFIDKDDVLTRMLPAHRHAASDGSAMEQ